MAYTVANLQVIVTGNKRLAIGTFTGDAVGSTINTGLSRIDVAKVQPLGTSIATGVTLTGSFPTSTGVLTIMSNSASATGIFMAIGT